MTFSERFHEIRIRFERPFWVANISELFERLSYYAAFALLPRYLHESLNFGVERSSSLAGLFGGLVWFLAAFGGAVADRMGFRPIYIHDYVNAKSNTEMLLMWDSLTVIALQMVVSILTQKMPSFHGITLGTLISGLAWILMILHPSVTIAVATLMVVAIGEITQQPRYYEYISRLAPFVQQGTYGLCLRADWDWIACGRAVWRVPDSSLRGSSASAATHLVGVSGVGVATSGRLWVYDRWVRRDAGSLGDTVDRPNCSSWGG